MPTGIKVEVTHSNPDAVLTDIFGHSSPSNGETTEGHDGVRVEYPTKQPMQKDLGGPEGPQFALEFVMDVGREALKSYVSEKLKDAVSIRINGEKTETDEEAIRRKIDEAYNDL